LTRLSCGVRSPHAVRLQLHATRYNISVNFLRPGSAKKPITDWSADELKEGEKLIKNRREEGVSHGRYIAFQRRGGRQPTANVPGDFADECRTYVAQASRCASVRRRLLMRSRANRDGRSAFKSHGKWPDQPLDNRGVCPSDGSRPRRPPLSCRGERGNRANIRGCSGSSGESRALFKDFL